MSEKPNQTTETFRKSEITRLVLIVLVKIFLEIDFNWIISQLDNKKQDYEKKIAKKDNNSLLIEILLNIVKKLASKEKTIEKVGEIQDNLAHLTHIVKLWDLSQRIQNENFRNLVTSANPENLKMLIHGYKKEGTKDKPQILLTPENFEKLFSSKNFSLFVEKINPNVLQFLITIYRYTDETGTIVSKNPLLTPENFEKLFSSKNFSLFVEKIDYKPLESSVKEGKLTSENLIDYIEKL